MGQIARILGAVRPPAPAGACDGLREPERPVSFAEITAASAFLDFGGVPDGHWPHAGGSPEAAIFDRRARDRLLHRAFCRIRSGTTTPRKGAAGEEQPTARAVQSMLHAKFAARTFSSFWSQIVTLYF
jgi:hypothetical protein